MQRYHIVTMGGYGCNDVGDEAMPKTIILNLRKKFGDCLDITMLSPYPHFTEEFHKEKSLPDIHFDFYEDSFIQLLKEQKFILDWAERFHNHPIWTKILIKKIIKKKRRTPYLKLLSLFKTLKSADAVLNVGGGNINGIMKGELFKKCTIYKICDLFNVPVFVSGQTIGPFYEDDERILVRESINTVEVLTFRDKGISANRIKELGITENNYKKIPIMYDAGDDALSLPYVSSQEAWEIINNEAPEEWKNFKAEYVFALNLKASLNSFKGRGRKGDLTSETVLLAKISEYILSNFSSKILFVPTDYCEGVDDRVVLRKVLNKIDENYKSKIVLLEGIYNDHQLKGVISCCDFAFGARYHFNVFSLSTNIPSIGMASGIYQQTKLDGIYSLLKLKEFYIEKDMEFASLDDVAPVIHKLVQNKDNIRKILAQNVPPLIEKSKKIVDIIFERLVKNV